MTKTEDNPKHLKTRFDEKEVKLSRLPDVYKREAIRKREVIRSFKEHRPLDLASPM